MEAEATPHEDREQARQEAPTPKRSRTTMVMVRLSEAEYERLANYAQESSLPIATYVRTVALHQRLPPVVPAVSYDAVKELRRIGNNLNQALVAVYTRDLAPSLRPFLLELITLCRKLRAELVGQVAEDYERTPAPGLEALRPANDLDSPETDRQ